MVVTRRQSAGPLPAVASRTNSTSGSRAKGKGVDKSAGSPLKDAGAGPSSSHVPPNGIPMAGPRVLEDITFDDDIPNPPRATPSKPVSPKPKTKSKSKRSPKAKKQHAKGISLFDILARLFLLWFTIYTLAVCPDDVALRSPVCRALTQYRHAFLEPYVYPPIRFALEHPAVAPHIQRATPYYHRAVAATTPLVRRGKHEWRTRVVPQAQWLQRRARPYVRRVERQYDAHLAPYVRQAEALATRYRTMAEPYVASASLKTQQSWTAARPYVLPLWRSAQQVPEIVVRVVGGPLGDARRQWVDPQVAKIWDAVVEQGGAGTSKVKTASSSVVVQSTVVSSSAAASSAPQSVSSKPVKASTASLEDVPESSISETSTSLPPVPEPTEEAAASASSSSIVANSISPSSSSPTSEASTVESIPSSSSDPAPSAESPIPEATDDAALSASSVIYESVYATTPSDIPDTVTTACDVPDPVPSSTNAEPPLPEEEPPLLDEETLDDDLNTFLFEIGADEPEVSEPPPPPPPPPVHEETEEEKAERLRLKAIETAEKRADIEGRHTQWEIDLEKFGKAQRKVVRTTLNLLRGEAAEEARAPGSAVRTHVEGLVQEAEKSLKALRAYARKLGGEEKTEGEKVRAWESVVGKVDKKFGERVEKAADAVREWWVTYADREIVEVDAIAQEVKLLAERAQADIGMDYSWLADVSYYDWQRYHKLVDTSKEFTDIYLSMANGTHPNAPANAVAEVMEALQEEVDDLILGFEAELGRVKSAALDAFTGRDTAAPTDSGSAPDPDVSILPIEPEPVTKKGGAEIPPVILSRGAEEVEAAVRRAEEAKTQAHEEL